MSRDSFGSNWTSGGVHSSSDAAIRPPRLPSRSVAAGTSRTARPSLLRSAIEIVARCPGRTVVRGRTSDGGSTSPPPDEGRGTWKAGTLCPAGHMAARWSTSSCTWRRTGLIASVGWRELPATDRVAAARTPLAISSSRIDAACETIEAACVVTASGTALTAGPESASAPSNGIRRRRKPPMSSRPASDCVSRLTSAGTPGGC